MSENSASSQRNLSKSAAFVAAVPGQDWGARIDNYYVPVIAFGITEFGAVALIRSSDQKRIVRHTGELAAPGEW